MESDGGLSCGVEEWVAESDGGADSCGVQSGQETGGAASVSFVKNFECPEAGDVEPFGLFEVFSEVKNEV